MKIGRSLKKNDAILEMIEEGIDLELITPFHSPSVPYPICSATGNSLYRYIEEMGTFRPLGDSTAIVMVMNRGELVSRNATSYRHYVQGSLLPQILSSTEVLGLDDLSAQIQFLFDEENIQPKIEAYYRGLVKNKRILKKLCLSSKEGWLFKDEYYLALVTPL